MVTDLKVKLGNDCLNAGTTEHSKKEQIRQKEDVIGVRKTSEFWKQHERTSKDRCGRKQLLFVDWETSYQDAVASKLVDRFYFQKLKNLA